MKRLLSVLLALALLMALPGAAAYAEERPIVPTVLLDGFPLTFDVDPMILDGRTLVPFRAIAEALGVDLIWNEANRSIQAYGPESVVVLHIDDPIMYVNGTATTLDVPPRIVGSRTLVPLRAFSTAFGAEIDWDGDTYTVFITSPVRAMRMLGFYAIRSFPRRHLVPAFSDVAYGWAQLHEDGSLDLEGDDYYWPEPAGEITPERLLDEARAAGTKRFLMIHGLDGDQLVTNLVLDPTRSSRLVDAATTLVLEKGFDGVLLDLEGLGWSEQGEELAAVRQGFVALVGGLAERMRAMGKETAVSVPPPPPNGWYHGYDYAALAEVADVLQLMAHDYRGDEPEPIEMVDEGIRLAIAAVGEANRQKLLLGVRLYETPDSLRQLVGLAKRHRLGGISFWFLGRLTDEQMAALQSTVTRSPALLSPPVAP